MSEPTTTSVARRVYLPFAAIALAAIALDQLTKQWAVSRLSNERAVHLVGSLELRLAFNKGMAFSQGTNRGPLIAAVGVGIVVFLAFYARTVQSRVAVLLMGLVAGGALGNISDRLFRSHGHGFLGGGVVDFIYLRWWPTFNVADSCVVVGGILLAIWIYRDGAPEQDSGTPGADAPTTSRSSSAGASSSTPSGSDVAT